MQDWLFLFVFGAMMIAAIAVIARLQGNRYQRYLTGHTAETAKITKGQADQLVISHQILAAHQAQVAALTRIAEALEKR